MKILSINSIQTFTNSKKSKAKFNNKMGTNITISQANSNGRWFIDNCSNPSDIFYIDEIKPEVIKKPKIEYEYYNAVKGEDGENILIPITGEIIMQNGKVKVIDGNNVYDFSGISFKKQNGELVQKVRHVKGYPTSVTEYKDGKEYKYTHYSQNSHKINQVYFFDGSFELSQNIAPQNTSSTIEFQTLNKRGEKTAVKFVAIGKENGQGSAQCEFPAEDGYRTITLNWSYPVVKYSFYGSAKEAGYMQNALIKLRDTIRSDEYKEDFASHSYLNRQLADAIGYLEDIKEKN